MTNQGTTSKTHSNNPEQALEVLRKVFLDDQPDYSIRVTDDDSLEGYLVIWNLPDEADPHLGACAKGGTRITEQVDLEEIARLAKTMALKNATANLPLGGAKSGIRADPDAPHFESTYRSFVRKLRPLLAENGGPFGGFGFDIGARPEQALWACDELSSTRSFTGKPVTLGGTDYDREGIAGLGVAVAARVTCEHFAESLETLRFAVQGAGAMGAGVIRYFSQLGPQLACIADPRLGGSYLLRQKPSVELLDAIAYMKFEEAARLLPAEADGPFALDDVLSADVDILFPCAVQDVLTIETISLVRARYIVEGANNPSISEAKHLFAQAGGVLIPDILANPGGIIAAFVEMQSGAGVMPPEGLSLVQHAKNEVRDRIEQNCKLVLSLAQKTTLDVSSSAQLLALSRMYPQHEASAYVKSLYRSANST